MSREPDPEEVAAVADELEAVLARLPALGCRVLELRLQGLEVAEIARAVRRSTKTVRRWLDTARRLFRDRADGAVESGAASPVRATDDLPLERQSPRSTSIRSSTVRLPRSRLRYGDYVLRHMIGAGASGKVYNALCRSTGEEVAVKFLRKSFVRDLEAIARFLAEANVLRRMKHRGIVRVHGIGAEQGRAYFIVMDLARGGDLGRRVRDGPVEIADAVRWTIEAAEAIRQAHRHGIVHCDLKPSNLLLSTAGHVVVTDFGLARSDSASAPRSTVLAGTPAFMAPEQITNSWGTIGPATDVYGLGAVLYALLTGRPPRSGIRTADILADIVAAKPISSPRSMRREIPETLSDICLKCLSKRPADRFDSVSKLIRSLRGISR